MNDIWTRLEQARAIRSQSQDEESLSCAQMKHGLMLVVLMKRRMNSARRKAYDAAVAVERFRNELREYGITDYTRPPRLLRSPYGPLPFSSSSESDSDEESLSSRAPPTSSSF